MATAILANRPIRRRCSERLRRGRCSGHSHRDRRTKTGSPDGVGIKMCCYGIKRRLNAIDGEAEEPERQHGAGRICALHNPDRAGCCNDRGPRAQHPQCGLGSGSHDKPCDHDHPSDTPEIECTQTSRRYASSAPRKTRCRLQADRQKKRSIWPQCLRRILCQTGRPAEPAGVVGPPI